ncbi:hypothetical protein GCM10010389_64370 [Streptomyces echinoruber]|uniref:Uncharacterized protein n=1 Tax=Streptomyces echinoruber TaxID=68898 RepID=A0A918RYA2_9ACTN|nr:hypothetical protein GCM10010389_64370 [Streptomyces echinoruber]
MVCAGGAASRRRRPGREAARGWTGTAAAGEGFVGGRGACGSVGAVSTVAKGHSRSARGQPVRGTHGRGYAARGVGPARIPGL